MGAFSPQSFRLSDYIRWDCTGGERGGEILKPPFPRPNNSTTFLLFVLCLHGVCQPLHIFPFSLSLRLYRSLHLQFFTLAVRARTHTLIRTRKHTHWLKTYTRTFKHLSTLFKDSNSCQERRTRIFCNRQNWNVTRSHNPTLEMDTSADQIFFFLLMAFAFFMFGRLILSFVH